MTRRKFIIGILVLGVTVVGGTIAITSFETIVFRILKNQLNYLKIEDNVFESFVSDIRQSDYYAQKDFGRNKQLFVRIFHFFDNAWLPLPGKDRFDRYCEILVNDFLLSTDFFVNKMDETRPVSYIALYEPYKRPCSNPFSNLYYPAA